MTRGRWQLAAEENMVFALMEVVMSAVMFDVVVVSVSDDNDATRQLVNTHYC